MEKGERSAVAGRMEVAVPSSLLEVRSTNLGKKENCGVATRSMNWSDEVSVRPI